MPDDKHSQIYFTTTQHVAEKINVTWQINRCEFKLRRKLNQGRYNHSKVYIYRGLDTSGNTNF